MGWVRTEVDGVPTFWSEYDGDLRAGLVFRVGVAGEALPHRGITHLVEHLALHGLSQSDYHANGEVDAITTNLDVGGRCVPDFAAGKAPDQPVLPRRKGVGLTAPQGPRHQHHRAHRPARSGTAQ